MRWGYIIHRFAQCHNFQLIYLFASVIDMDVMRRVILSGGDLREFSPFFLWGGMDVIDARDWYEERAAILEYDGKLTRWIAESRAKKELEQERKRHGAQ